MRLFKPLCFGLMIYSFIGAFACIFGIIFFSINGVPIDDFVSIKPQMDGLSQDINELAGFVDSASKASSNAGNTLSSAKSSLDSASFVTNEAGNSMNSVSQFVGFEILGWKPLEETYSYFLSSGKDLKSLGNDLGNTALHVGRNAEDMNELSQHLISVRNKVNIIGETVKELGELPNQLRWNTPFIITINIILVLILIHFLTILFISISIVSLYHEELYINKKTRKLIK